MASDEMFEAPFLTKQFQELKAPFILYYLCFHQIWRTRKIRQITSIRVATVVTVLVFVFTVWLSEWISGMDKKKKKRER